MKDHKALVDGWRADFEAAHAADALNARRQGFEDYWKWIEVFLLTGGAGQRGWLESGEAMLRKVSDPEVAAHLRTRLHSLGKAIAREWAKDSRHRRVHTTSWQGVPNLQAWGRRLRHAAASDTGDGEEIAAALDAIEEELREALRGGAGEP